jgi:hypothetical protein
MPRRFFCARGVVAVTFLAVWIGSPHHAAADNIYWQGGVGDWFNAGNWLDESNNTQVVPGSSDDVFVGSGGGPIISGGNASAAVLNLSGGGYTQSAGSASFGQIVGTGAVTITGGSTALLANGLINQFSSLSISGPGVLNVTNNIVDINYTGTSPAPQIRANLVSGFDNLKWDGPGINSSLAGPTNNGTAVGYMDTGSQVIVRYTWYGDLNLDGVVSAADLQAMQFNTGTTWSTGDLNYNGQVTADDYALFQLGLAFSSGHNILPEPGMAMTLIVLCGSSLGRRRQSRRGGERG